MPVTIIYEPPQSEETIAAQEDTFLSGGGVCSGRLSSALPTCAGPDAGAHPPIQFVFVQR